MADERRTALAAASRRAGERLEAKTAADVAASSESVHRPVMLDECVALVTGNLAASAAGRTPVVVDCTLGLAGHATAFLKAAPAARLIGIDRDAEALGLAAERMAREGLADRFTPVHAAFDDLTAVLADQGVAEVDAVFMDLGLSSLQIDETDRGFSYSVDAPLDMRMDPTQPLTAARVLADYPEAELARIFRDWGEERFARPIARAVVRLRESGGSLATSADLNALVDRTVPHTRRPAGNPAKRVFQALRIEVNGELAKLAATLPQAALALAVGGRLVVESYHSLEDRTVKSFLAQGLVVDAPAGLPVVPPDMQPFLTDLTHGAAKAPADEVAANPRSASVRLRAAELTRPIPGRWRRRFAAGADATDGGDDPRRAPERRHRRQSTGQRDASRRRSGDHRQERRGR